MKNNIKNILENNSNKIINIINKNKIKIVGIFYLISILMYEICFCNVKIFEGGRYNFSLCRIVIYIIFIIIFLKFKNIIFCNIDKSFEDNLKKILLITYIVLSIISLPVFVFVGIRYGIEVAAIGIIIMLLSGIFSILISEDLIKNTIITTFTLGLVFCFITNFNHVLDERKHFMSSFNISFGNLNYEEKILCDQQVLNIGQLEKFIIAIDKFEGVYKAEIVDMTHLLDPSSTPAGNSFILYIPSAIGMLFSRVLQGSLLDMYIVGRLFNLITYTLIIICALKFLPYKKNIFYLVFNMPLILLLAASYSIDGLSLALISVFITYCLKLSEQNEKITIRQIFILVFFATFLVIAKSMAYIGVGLLVFILPFKKILKENKKYIPLFIAIAVLGIILAIVLIFNVNIETDIRNNNTDSNGQVSYLLSNPMQLIPIFYRHIRDTLLDFAWLTSLNPEVFFYSFSNCTFILMFLIFVIVSVNDESKKFNLKDKIIFLTTFFIVYAMTSIALYIGFSAKGGKFIEGYQTRYIIPILPLVLMCMNNKLIKIQINCNEKLLIAIAWGIITIIDLVGLIAV